MTFNFQANAAIATGALRRSAEALRRFLFGRYDRHINDVRVSITDHRNRYGAAQLCCQVEVMLDNHVSVITRQTDSDAEQALKAAFSKAARTIAQRLRRRRRLHGRLEAQLAAS